MVYIRACAVITAHLRLVNCALYVISCFYSRFHLRMRRITAITDSYLEFELLLASTIFLVLAKIA